METMLLKAFFTLLALVGTLVVVLYMVRQYTAKQLTQQAGAQFRVLGQLALQPKKRIYLLLVADKILVIGAAEQSMVTLAEISDPATVTALIEAKMPTASLSALWTTKKAPNGSTTSPSANKRPEAILSFSEFLKSWGK